MKSDMSRSWDLLAQIPAIQQASQFLQIVHQFHFILLNTVCQGIFHVTGVKTLGFTVV
jgi:hypothetical protein